MSQLNNALVSLFKYMEDCTEFNFPTFTVTEISGSAQNNNVTQDKKFLKQYQEINEITNNAQPYKFLYDPGLNFSFRFHQRLARINYTDRSQPWISIMFNTGEVKPLTGVLSHIYDQIKIEEEESIFYDVQIRRVLTPINLVFISNDIDYLYRFLHRLSFYFDRITQYKYYQNLTIDEDNKTKYEFVGMAKDIVQKDLNKLDTEQRGSLATAGYSFDLIYFVMDEPLEGYLLEHIDLRIKLIENNSNFLNLTCMP